jgi:hypothetical protein
MYVQCPLLLDTSLSNMEECAHMKRRFKESVAGGLDHLLHDHIDPTLHLLVSASRLTSGRHIGGMSAGIFSSSTGLSSGSSAGVCVCVRLGGPETEDEQDM